MVTAIIVVIVVLLLAAALRLWLTASRLDRLHIRTEAAWAALESALSRRIVAARALAAAGHLSPELAMSLRRCADAADRAERPDRLAAERRLARALADVGVAARGELADEIADAAERVVLATQFYNDAVRDTRGLRSSWFTRFFRLAGHARLPEYFALVELGADGTSQAAAPGVPAAG